MRDEPAPESTRPVRQISFILMGHKIGQYQRSPDSVSKDHPPTEAKSSGSVLGYLLGVSEPDDQSGGAVA